MESKCKKVSDFIGISNDLSDIDPKSFDFVTIESRIAEIPSKLVKLNIDKEITIEFNIKNLSWDYYYIFLNTCTRVSNFSSNVKHLLCIGDIGKDSPNEEKETFIMQNVLTKHNYNFDNIENDQFSLILSTEHDPSSFKIEEGLHIWNVSLYVFNKLICSNKGFVSLAHSGFNNI